MSTSGSDSGPPGLDTQRCACILDSGSVLSLLEPCCSTVVVQQVQSRRLLLLLADAEDMRQQLFMRPGFICIHRELAHTPSTISISLSSELCLFCLGVNPHKAHTCWAQHAPHELRTHEAFPRSRLRTTYTLLLRLDSCSNI